MSIAAREIRVSQGPLPGRGGEPGEGKKPFRRPPEDLGQGAEGAYPVLESRGEWAQAAHLFPESRRPGAELLPPPESWPCAKRWRSRAFPEPEAGKLPAQRSSLSRGGRPPSAPRGGGPDRGSRGRSTLRPREVNSYHTPGAREAGGGAERGGALSAFRPLTTSAREIRMKGARAPEGTHALTARQEPAWSAPFGETALVQPARQEPRFLRRPSRCRAAERSATPPAEALRAAEGAGAPGTGLRTRCWSGGRGGSRAAEAAPSSPGPGSRTTCAACPTGRSAFCVPDRPRRRPAGAWGWPGTSPSLPRQGDTVAWTAPDYRPPRPPRSTGRRAAGKGPRRARRSASATRRSSAPPTRSNRMIEERLRRERRRLGF